MAEILHIILQKKRSSLALKLKNPYHLLDQQVVCEITPKASFRRHWWRPRSHLQREHGCVRVTIQTLRV